MIHLSDFEKEFKGETFKDITDIDKSHTYICVGYGDNGSKGNPYLVGMYPGSARGGARYKTVLLSDVLVVPKT